MPASLVALLLALAGVGFLDALYFTLVAYRAMAPDPRWLPRFCRMEERTCATVVETRYARLFGLPNSVYGLAWYALVATGALAALATGAWPLCAAYLAASALTVAVSAYLAWALLARLRVPCPLCFLGHAVNAAILLGLAAACTRGG